MAVFARIEVHALGQTFGIDPLRPAIKLPALDRIGLACRWPKPKFVSETIYSQHNCLN